MKNAKKIKRSTAATLAEWIQLYEEKTGEKDIRIPDGFQMFYLRDRGFAMFKADYEGKMLYIYHLCGDGKFWKDFGEILCYQNNLNCIGTIVTRPIDAYIRFWGWKKINEEVNQYGQRRIKCIDKCNRTVLLTYKNTDDESKEDVYWLTYYL